jgi:hypothetical protein
MLFAFIRRLVRDQGGDSLAALVLCSPLPAMLYLSI